MDFTKLPSLAFILLSVIAKTVLSNPIRQSTYNTYSRLICDTNKLWTEDYLLYTNFKSSRLPELFEITGVTVPNLRLTSEMTTEMRASATEIDLLADHRDFLYHYKYIIDDVLVDELMTNSGTSYENDIENVRNYISKSINELENTMIHLGESAQASADMPVEERPYFDPEREEDTYDRYKRDLYIFEQMKVQLQKAVQDFTKLRTEYLEATTDPYDCANQ